MLIMTNRQFIFHFYNLMIFISTFLTSSKKLSPSGESFSPINIIYPLYPHALTDCPPFPDTCRVRTGV